jgi:hypothetical protein
MIEGMEKPKRARRRKPETAGYVEGRNVTIEYRFAGGTGRRHRRALLLGRPTRRSPGSNGVCLVCRAMPPTPPRRSSARCRIADEADVPRASIHAFVPAFAIAPDAVQDRCLRPDACIHAFGLRSRPCQACVFTPAMPASMPSSAPAMSRYRDAQLPRHRHRCSPRPPSSRCLHPCLRPLRPCHATAMRSCLRHRHRCSPRPPSSRCLPASCLRHRHRCSPRPP